MPIINMVYKKKKWWKPWANTIAYFPLKEDASDYSWNWYNGTRVGTETYTLLWWVQAATFSTNTGSQKSAKNYITTTADRHTQPITFSWWIYQIDTNYDWKNPFSNSNLSDSSNNNYGIRTARSYQLNVWWSSTDYDTSTPVLYDQWTLLTTTIENWISKFYVNWTLKYTANVWWDAWVHWNWSIWAKRWDAFIYWWDWWVREFILENKARTAQEILYYYNLTKANYGL